MTVPLALCGVRQKEDNARENLKDGSGERDGELSHMRQGEKQRESACVCVWVCETARAQTSVALWLYGGGPGGGRAQHLTPDKHEKEAERRG